MHLQKYKIILLFYENEEVIFLKYRLKVIFLSGNVSEGKIFIFILPYTVTGLKGIW